MGRIKVVPNEYYPRYSEIIMIKENLLTPVDWRKPDVNYFIIQIKKRVFSLEFIVPLFLLYILIMPVTVYNMSMYYLLVLVSVLFSYFFAIYHQFKSCPKYLDSKVASKLDYRNSDDPLKPFDHKMTVEIAKANNINLPKHLVFDDMYRLIFGIEKLSVRLRREMIKPIY